MKKLFIAVTLVTLTSCHEPNVETKSSKYRIGTYGKKLQVVKIEGCEYLFAEYDRGAIFEHKGNCTNSIHKNKSE